jgi:hypothetical protein
MSTLSFSNNGVHTPTVAARPRAALLDTRSLAVGITGFLLLDQVLLLAMLGFAPLAQAGAAVLSAVLCAALWRTRGWMAGPAVSPKAFAGLFLAALVIFALGGEGRFFYANTDWQVRYAVLNDLVNNPWPWAYQTASGITVQRSPVAIYLVPALVGKVTGHWGAELMLLVQNAALLAALLALVAPAFSAISRPWLTLLLVIGFAGLDVIGQLAMGGSLLVHLEQWAELQYTGTLTLAYWVPQHALAGWIGAAFYLCWRAGKLPLAALLAVVPAMALLSPLGGLGIVPFAALAGITALLNRRLGANDVLLPALSCALAVPSLLYLGSGLGSVSTGASHYDPLVYLAFYILEIIPFLSVVWLTRGSWSLDRATVLLAVVMVLVLPFGRIGEKIDFMMRVSIPSLTFLAILMAGVLRSAPGADDQNGQAARRIAVIVFLVGLVVPVGETARAVLLPRAPAVLCGYYGVVPGGYATYIAPLDKMNSAIRPKNPTLVPIREPKTCWNGRWPDAARPDFAG